MHQSQKPLSSNVLGIMCIYSNVWNRVTWHRFLPIRHLSNARKFHKSKQESVILHPEKKKNTSSGTKLYKAWCATGPMAEDSRHQWASACVVQWCHCSLSCRKQQSFCYGWYMMLWISAEVRIVFWRPYPCKDATICLYARIKNVYIYAYAAHIYLHIHEFRCKVYVCMYVCM